MGQGLGHPHLRAMRAERHRLAELAGDLGAPGAGAVDQHIGAEDALRCADLEPGLGLSDLRHTGVGSDLGAGAGGGIGEGRADQPRVGAAVVGRVAGPDCRGAEPGKAAEDLGWLQVLELQPPRARRLVKAQHVGA